MKCAILKCKNKEKIYGVCGVHKSFAFKSDDPDFQKDLNFYIDLLHKIYEEATKLEENNINLLTIKNYWQLYGSTWGDISLLPDHFKIYGANMKQQLQHVEDMQIKYNPSLCSNATSISAHRILDPSKQCPCTICSLMTGTAVIPKV